MTSWYPITSLTLESEPVVFRLPEGDGIGFLHLVGRPPRAKYRIRVDRTNTFDLPDHHIPLGWRPLNAETWPEPLPQPYNPVKPQEQPEPPPRVPFEPLAKSEWWVVPDFRLGQPHELPVHRRECEARILRSYRTSKYLNDLDQNYHGGSAAWPPALMIEARVVQKMLSRAKTGKLAFLRPEDYRDIHVHNDNLEARPAPWVPDRRDLSDMMTVNDWMRGVSRKQSFIITLRADEPPYSFPQIDDAKRWAQDTARRAYHKAIDIVWERLQ